jgi:EAL domain-containing protein (putative c-di-GMP-specific phosphodiesterase class I)
MLIEDSESVLGIMTQARCDGRAHRDRRLRHRAFVAQLPQALQRRHLKIDRSFIKEAPDDAEVGAIAEAVIALGHGLRLKVVAEGVETVAQAEFLRARGCDELQGYLLSRPLEPESFAAWFERREALESVELA